MRALAPLIGAGLDWPERVLAELGRLALLTRAIARLDALPGPLAADVKDALGWGPRKDDVLAHGDRLRDRWLVVAQVTERDPAAAAAGESARARAALLQQRTWLVGQESAREALIVQYAFGGRDFPEPLVPGTTVPGELAFWPGALALRATFAERVAAVALAPPLPHRRSVAAALTAVADSLARCPWTRRFGLALADVVPTLAPPGAWLVDPAGDALPLPSGPPPWALLALSGGHPLDVVGEWHQGAFHPLAAVAAGHWYALPRGAA